MELPAARIEGATFDRFTVIVPSDRFADWAALRKDKKYDASNQLYVKVGTPKRPRTTGYRSSNSHIHGHAQQIGEFTGDYKEDVINEAKRRAVTHGYPTRQNSFGNIVPVSERDISTTEAGMLIDELHMIASDIDVTLKEYDDA